MTPIVHMPRGLQAAGKSTLARQLAAKGAVIISLDAHRARVWPDCPKAWDPFTGCGLAVQRAFEAELRMALAAGSHIVVDRTNLSAEGPARIRTIANHYGARVIVHDLTHVGLDVCIARDSQRPTHTQVGAKAIRESHARWIGGTH